MEEFEHTMPIEQLLEKLEVPNIKSGITDQQLISRLSQSGYNIPTKTSNLRIFLLTLQENLHFLLYIGILTVLLTVLVEKGPSVSLSHIFLIAFTFVGHMIDLFMVEKPKVPKFGTLIAVIRNGKSNIVDSKYLVRGDIVELEQSMIAPADIRLIKVNNMLVNGSSLLQKEGIRMASAAGSGDYFHSPNMIFQGFKVETGKGIGIVLNTGSKTVLAQSTIQTQGQSRSEIYFHLAVFAFVVFCVLYNYYVGKFRDFQSVLVLAMGLTKLPHFVRKGRSTSLLSISHLLISQNVYPKAIQAFSTLMRTNYLVYDIRDVLITTKKEIKKVYINDALQNVHVVKQQSQFLKMVKLANHALYKDPVVEESRENVPLEDWDPKPKEKEYEHPVEITLREFISQFNLGKPDQAEHLKVPLTSKNRNSLTVVTPKDSEPLAILIGDASDIIKNCKKMHVNSQDVDLPSRSLTSLCEDLSLEGNLCIGLGYSEIDRKLITSGEDLKPDVFDFSLLGIFIIKEYTEDNQGALELAQSLNITTIGIGRSGKDYLLNLAYSAKLITDPPEDLISKPSTQSKSCNVLLSPSTIIQDYSKHKTQNMFIPGIGLFDTTHLLNQMSQEEVCYVGNNHLALQLCQVGASFEISSKEVKDLSNFVLLSNTPLMDLLRAIKLLRSIGSNEFFFMLENVACFIPSFTYFAVFSYLDIQMSSFGMLLIEFGVPLLNQFTWIGLPKAGYPGPVMYWSLCSALGFYNYFQIYSEGLDIKYCNFAYFFTVFICGFMKVMWLHAWNWNKCKNSWHFAYTIAAIKIVCFWLFGIIRFVANRNLIEVGYIGKLVPGFVLFWPSMLGLYLVSRK